VASLRSRALTMQMTSRDSVPLRVVVAAAAAAAAAGHRVVMVDGQDGVAQMRQQTNDGAWAAAVLDNEVVRAPTHQFQ